MRIVFAGTPRFASDHLDALVQAGFEVCNVWTRPDKPGKRGRQLIASPVKKLAIEYGITVYQPAFLDRSAADHLGRLKPDIMVVVAFGQILPEAVLKCPGYGCINVHTSILPRWRGAAPVQRAIQAGDTETGVSIIQMDAGLDTGAILASKRCAVDNQDNSATLLQKLSSIGPKLLIDTLKQISDNAVTPVVQSSDGITYARKLTKQEAAIDWSGTASEVDRNIRMLNPSPVAFTWIHDLRIKVWRAECCELTMDTDTGPGTILDLKKDGLYVACGAGVLRLTALQIPLGKGKILTASDLYNSRKDLFVQGDVLRAK